MRTVEELVEEFQNGKQEVFTELYTVMAHKQGQLETIARRKLPLFVSDADITALYDDSFLTAASTFDGSKGLKFVTLLSNIMQNKCVNLYTSYKTQKRENACGYDLSMDYTDSEGNCVAETIEDFQAEDAVLQSEGSEIINLLEAYRVQGKSSEVNAVLILQDSMYYGTADEKYDRMRAITGLPSSNAALRKRCQRAKEDFRKFVEDHQYVV